MNAYFKDLNSASFEPGPTESMLSVPHGGEVQTLEEGGERGDDRGALNAGLLSHLLIASMCMFSYKASLQPDPVSEQPDKVALEELKEAGELHRDSSKTKTRRAARDSRKGDTGVLKQGSAHPEALLHGTCDKAVTYT